MKKSTAITGKRHEVLDARSAVYLDVKRAIQLSIANLYALPVRVESPKVRYNILDPQWVEARAATLAAAPRREFLSKVKRESGHIIQRWELFMPESLGVQNILKVFQPEFLRSVSLLTEGTRPPFFQVWQTDLSELIDAGWEAFVTELFETLKGESVCIAAKSAVTAAVANLKAAIGCGGTVANAEKVYAALPEVFTRIAEGFLKIDANAPTDPNYSGFIDDDAPLVRPYVAAIREYWKNAKKHALDSVNVKTVKTAVADIFKMSGSVARFSPSVKRILVSAFQSEGKVLYQSAQFSESDRTATGARKAEFDIEVTVPDGGEKLEKVVKEIRGFIRYAAQRRYIENDGDKERGWIARRWKEVEDAITGGERCAGEIWEWRAFSEDEAKAIVESFEECVTIDRNPGKAGDLGELSEQFERLSRQLKINNRVNQTLFRKLCQYQSMLDGDYNAPNQRKPARQKLVEKVLDRRGKLILNGTKKREALTDAVREILKENGNDLAGFKDETTLRDAAAKEIRKQDRRRMPIETEVKLPK